MSSKRIILRLDEIAQINPKRRVKKGTSVPFIDMAALPQNFRDIKDNDVEIRVAKGAGAHFQNGDTLLARITPCLENGKTAQVNCLDKNCIGEGSTEFIVLCGIDHIDNDYIYYLCRDPIFRKYAIRHMEGTSGRQRVSWRSIAAYEFPFPQPNERRVAAQVLSLIDDHIKLLSDMNSTIEAIAQSLFKSWFVDFDPVCAKQEGKKPEGMDVVTASLFPNSFEVSEFGKIPKGWKPELLGNLVIPKRGKIITKATSIEGNIPVVAGGIDPAYFHNQSNVSGPVVTISSSGNAGFVRLYQQDIWASDCSYISKEQSTLVFYWYLLLKSNQEKIYFMRHGAVQQHVNPSDLMRLKIIFTDNLEIVSIFNEIVSPLFIKIGENNLEIQILSNIRDVLLPKLILGKLKIPNVEEINNKTKVNA